MPRFRLSHSRPNIRALENPPPRKVSLLSYRPEIRPVIKLLAPPMTNQLMINPKMVITVTSPMVDGMVTGVTMVTNLMVTTVTGATNPMVTGVTTVTNQMVTTVISPMVTGVTTATSQMVTNQRKKSQNQLISLPSLIIQDVKKLN